MTGERKFQRRTEDFTCEHCGEEVKGDGYTNHCPACLWSKHVDVNPGDRAESCGGMMQPMGIELLSGEYRIVHRCERCGEVRKNKRAENDNFDTLVELAARQARD